MKQKSITPSVPTPQFIQQGWVAGMRWVRREKTKLSLSAILQRQTSTLRLIVRHANNEMMGLTRPVRQKSARLHSLAAVFALRNSEHQNSYGIYQLDQGRWLFLATTDGVPSVMGDVCGTSDDVLAAQSRFLAFNDNDDVTCICTLSDSVSWRQLTTDLTWRQKQRARLHTLPTVTFVFRVAVLLGIVACGAGYWYSQISIERAQMEEAARQAALALRDKMKKKPEVLTAPHPWASVWPTSYFLSKCFFARQPLPISIAGWRLSTGECVSNGIRLRYNATPGSTVSDFSRRARQLLGRDASFNLLQGGQTGDVFVPFINDANGAVNWRDEAVPGVTEQLMRFISHFQRRNITVPLSEVKSPELPPGDSRKLPVQDWREYTFSISSKLAPEWLFTDLDDTGLRLTSVAFTISQQGQIEYAMKGSLYAQK